MEKIKIKQQRDVGDLIKDAFILLYTEGRPLWHNVLLYILPLFLLTGIVAGFWLYDFSLEMAKLGKEATPDEMTAFFQNCQEKLINKNYFGMIVAMFISVSLLASTVYNFVFQYAENEQVNEAEVRAAGLKDSGWMIGFNVICAWVISLGLSFFFVPGVFLSIWASLLAIVAVVERKSFLESLGRCREVLAGNWLQTFFLLFVLGIIFLVLNILLTGIVRMFIFPLNGMLGTKNFAIVESILNMGIFAIIASYLYTMLIMHYYSLVSTEEK